MSNNEYTPTTSFVRREYITGRLRRSDGTAPEARSEFDRWLAELERAAAEKAWNAGHRAGIRWKPPFTPVNPYRQKDS